MESVFYFVYQVCIRHFLVRLRGVVFKHMIDFIYYAYLRF
jgi:hypothetical protein